MYLLADSGTSTLDHETNMNQCHCRFIIEEDGFYVSTSIDLIIYQLLLKNMNGIKLVVGLFQHYLLHFHTISFVIETKLFNRVS